MIRGILYKHRRNTDVAFYPLNVEYDPNLRAFFATGDWYNITNPAHLYTIVRFDTIKIKEEDIDKWEIYEPLQKTGA